MSPESLATLMEGTGNAIPRQRARTGALDDISVSGEPEIAEEPSTSSTNHPKTTNNNNHKSAISAEYESLNYQVCENELLKKSEQSPKHQVCVFQPRFNTTFEIA